MNNTQVTYNISSEQLMLIDILKTMYNDNLRQITNLTHSNQQIRNLIIQILNTNINQRRNHNNNNHNNNHNYNNHNVIIMLMAIITMSILGTQTPCRISRSGKSARLNRFGEPRFRRNSAISSRETSSSTPRAFRAFLISGLRACRAATRPLR